MRRDKLIKAVLLTTFIVFSASSAYAQEFTARLNGFEELGAINAQTGAILSDGTGTLRLHLDKNRGMATFTLTYSDVGTTAPLTGTVTQAHIHFGKRRDSGGVMVFFCSNLGNGPSGTPTCPTNSGTVRGSFTAASVVAIPTQNVKADDFNALIEALESNTAYANIHTTALPAGEIRGQVQGNRGDQGNHNGQGQDN